MFWLLFWNWIKSASVKWLTLRNSNKCQKSAFHCTESLNRFFSILRARRIKAAARWSERRNYFLIKRNDGKQYCFHSHPPSVLMFVIRNQARRRTVSLLLIETVLLLFKGLVLFIFSLHKKLFLVVTCREVHSFLLRLSVPLAAGRHLK